MPDYISGDLRTKSKEAAEEAFQILNLICYTFHPELEAVEPIFKGTRYHIYLGKRREKNGGEKGRRRRGQGRPGREGAGRGRGQGRGQGGEEA